MCSLHSLVVSTESAFWSYFIGLKTAGLVRRLLRRIKLGGSIPTGSVPTGSVPTGYTPNAIKLKPIVIPPRFSNGICRCR